VLEKSMVVQKYGFFFLFIALSCPKSQPEELMFQSVAY
jgi:hypothetical protein